MGLELAACPIRPAASSPTTPRMLDIMLDWVPDETIRNKILVDNPARLYGF